MGARMTFRERLADWISGGALQRREVGSIYKLGQSWAVSRDTLMADYGRLLAVLEDIAAQEKPTSNATVRRMARMAREALK